MLTGTFPSVAALVGNVFTATVSDGEEFIIDGEFSANTEIAINGLGVVGFHTSCSVELSVGDRFGPFTIPAGEQCTKSDPYHTMSVNFQDGL